MACQFKIRSFTITNNTESESWLFNAANVKKKLSLLS